VKVERREKLSAAEWGQVTSRRPVVRKVQPPQKPHTSGPNVPGPPTRTPPVSTDNASRTAVFPGDGQALRTG